MELARIALASREAEPVAWKVEHKIFRIKFIAEVYAGETGAAIEPLYATPPAPVDNTFIPKNLDRALGVVGVALPESKEEFNFQIERWIQRLVDRVIRYADEFKEQPAPVVPDERYQHLSELYHAQEKRLFKIAQRIKGPSFDKYSYSSSQAIDVLEEAIFGESAEEACRAEMFKNCASVKPSNDAGCATNNPSNCASVKDHQITASIAKGIALKLGAELNDEEADVFADGYNAALQSFGNPEQLEPVSQPYKLPPNSFTDSELEMMSHGDNPQANAYRELLAFRRNSPVIPDGWVACIKRLPEETKEPDGGATGYLVLYAEGKEPNGGFNIGVWNVTYLRQWWRGFITHWQPLPAAPQQEVGIQCCRRHPQTALQVHPLEMLMSLPPKPKMYCPECEPGVAERIDMMKNISSPKVGE
ncbi:hypothetical protein ACMG5J_03260 [Escherichia coli]